MEMMTPTKPETMTRKIGLYVVEGNDDAAAVRTGLRTVARFAGTDAFQKAVAYATAAAGGSATVRTTPDDKRMLTPTTGGGPARIRW